jgi:hypothetical protein
LLNLNVISFQGIYNVKMIEGRRRHPRREGAKT